MESQILQGPATFEGLPRSCQLHGISGTTENAPQAGGKTAVVFHDHVIVKHTPPPPLRQNDIYEWARDHRVHHKYSETDADPHNATRGFFFAHIGWLLVRKHPDVIEKGRKLELHDLLADKVVMFQRK